MQRFQVAEEACSLLLQYTAHDDRSVSVCTLPAWCSLQDCLVTSKDVHLYGALFERLLQALLLQVRCVVLC